MNPQYILPDPPEVVVGAHMSRNAYPAGDAIVITPEVAELMARLGLRCAFSGMPFAVGAKLRVMQQGYNARAKRGVGVHAVLDQFTNAHGSELVWMPGPPDGPVPKDQYAWCIDAAGREYDPRNYPERAAVAHTFCPR